MVISVGPLLWRQLTSSISRFNSQATTKAVPELRQLTKAQGKVWLTVHYMSGWKRTEKNEMEWTRKAKVGTVQLTLPHMHIYTHTHTLPHICLHMHKHTYIYTYIHPPTCTDRHTCKLVTTGPFLLFNTEHWVTNPEWDWHYWHAWSWQVTTQTLFPTLNCGPSSHSVLINHSFFLSPNKGHQRKGIPLFC